MIVEFRERRQGKYRVRKKERERKLRVCVSVDREEMAWDGVEPGGRTIWVKKKVRKGSHLRTGQLLTLENRNPLISLTQAVSIKVWWQETMTEGCGGNGKWEGWIISISLDSLRALKRRGERRHQLSRDARWKRTLCLYSETILFPICISQKCLIARKLLFF